MHQTFGTERKGAGVCITTATMIGAVLIQLSLATSAAAQSSTGTVKKDTVKAKTTAPAKPTTTTAKPAATPAKPRRDLGQTGARDGEAINRSRQQSAGTGAEGDERDREASTGSTGGGAPTARVASSSSAGGDRRAMVDAYRMVGVYAGGASAGLGFGVGPAGGLVWRQKSASFPLAWRADVSASRFSQQPLTVGGRDCW